MSTDTSLPQLKKSQATFPTQSEWAVIRDQANVLLKSGFLPAAIKNPEQAVAVMVKGREIGVPPMQAFTHVHVIQGKPTVSSELMLALVYKNIPGAQLNIVKSSATECEVEAIRPGGKAARFIYSMSDANRAKVTGKDSWKKYPEAMLRARAISAACRAVFPDALMGCSYTPEEMGAEVDSEGEIKEVKAEVAPKAQKPATAAAEGSELTLQEFDNLKALIREWEVQPEDFKEYLVIKFDVQRVSKLTKKQYLEVCADVERGEVTRLLSEQHKGTAKADLPPPSFDLEDGSLSL